MRHEEAQNNFGCRRADGCQRRCETPHIGPGVGGCSCRSSRCSRRTEMVGQREFMDVHDAWIQGKSISEIARQTGHDRKTIRRLLREGAQAGRNPRQISSKLDPFREYLLARMVGEDPVSNAEVLYDEIHELGYRGGRSI